MRDGRSGVATGHHTRKGNGALPDVPTHKIKGGALDWDEASTEVRALGPPRLGETNALARETFDPTSSIAPALGAQIIGDRSCSAYRHGVRDRWPSATIEANGVKT